MPKTARKSLRVLMAASEAVPFSKTGGLGDVIGALPAALGETGVEVAVVVPRYRSTKLENAKIIIPSVTVPLGDGLHFPSVVEQQGSGAVRWMFVDYPPFFDRDSLYVAPTGQDYYDNPERFSLFSRCVLEIAKAVFQPDVIHCHDWQAGLVPVLLKTAYTRDPVLKNLPAIITIHNLGYQGLFPFDSLYRSGLDSDLYRVDRLEFWGQVNFLKGSLLYADAITTVSKKYAQEIQTKEYGFGLEGVLQDRADHIRGILNGVDYAQWDPGVDPYIPAKYSPSNLEGKKACKRALLQEFGLPDSDMECPLLGIVSRFTAQKGADLIAAAAERMLSEKLCIVALGTGDAEYEKLFRTLAARHKEKVAVRVGFDNALAHRIEAGSDIFLMPSRYEPCGLNQIYSLRYGTVPLVRATGGLDDTIEDYEPGSGQGTGFKFVPYTSAAFLETLFRALTAYSQPAKWKSLMLNGMQKDFSWGNSAREYKRLYEDLVGKPQGQSPAESSPADEPAKPVKPRTAARKATSARKKA